jgi:N-acetylglucosaminyl-diphospho-decaprenol L-rhamnosyltransferase
MCTSVDVSVIIVNWNRLDDVLKNLRNLRHQTELRTEIVVVDNGSTDGSAERLSELGWIRLIRLATNVGPAEARNYGVRNASGEYIVFLDSDSLLPKSGLAKLVSRMEADPTIGIIACRIVNSRTRKIDAWIHALPASSHELLEFDTYSFCAAGAIARSHALRAAGPFWDELFIYNEEVDLSIRMLKAGYRIVYCPVVRVYHHVSENGRVATGVYWRLLIRNWIWIFYRHYPKRERLKKIVTYSTLYLIKGALNRRLTDCVKGILEGLWHTEIIGRFPDKLTPNEVDRLYALNRRTRLKIGR